MNNVEREPDARLINGTCHSLARARPKECAARFLFFFSLFFRSSLSLCVFVCLSFRAGGVRRRDYCRLYEPVIRLINARAWDLEVDFYYY